MNLLKYFVLFILCFFFLQNATAQSKKIAAPDIFKDLPIDDPAKNSILRLGEDSTQKIKKNIFVKGAISKSHCFLGEPVLLTYTLFTALQSTSTISTPSFAGFSVDAMEQDNEQVNHASLNGKIYRKFIVQKVQLVPLQEGAMTIDPVSVYNEVNYKYNEKDFHYSGTVHTGAIKIYVDSLPVGGRPVDFTGTTGNFTISVQADTDIAAGENDTLHMEIAGTGNFN